MEPMEDGMESSGPDESDGAKKTKMSILRPCSMVLMTITLEDYEKNYWPQLCGAIQHLLTTAPSDYIPISYEQMYTCVYKCVCKQFSERLYSDLIQTICTHLEQICLELTLIYQSHDITLYIERFHGSLGQYLHALKAIVPIFNYLSRLYVQPKLKTDLNAELVKLFVVIVGNKHISLLIPALTDVNMRPFAVSPAVMSTLIKDLYQIQPEYSQLRPQLFAKYIPNILPACSINDLDHYIQEARQMQRDLLMHPDFISGDQSRKRNSDDDHIVSPYSSSIPADYSNS